ncbi:unnamed protein product [Candida verbasci]|uniref:Ribosomal protein L30 ferredoxin-like fold domain-containing protein n=1 Tax=Candida verbasci TaxID=1227364 RepID=A0A9W4TRY2_9ASCO|nr:unnamed protein product [Candida verbasci]
MAILNSNPEILLKKRKNADRKRLEKQEQIREKLKEKQKLKKKNQNKFIRAETLVSNNKTNELERKRIKNLTKKAKTDSSDSNYKLLFLIRIPNFQKGLKIPVKAFQILKILKLIESNTGVFVKANNQVLNLLNLISPYIIIGQPSIQSIRKLFQKRARVAIKEDNEEEPKVVKLDNNQYVEDKFGNDLGLICIEDIIHELISLSDNFKIINGWLLPFKLESPINGWGPQSKLARLNYKDDNKVKLNLSQDLKLKEIEDIDKFIDQQN